jgi:hypothetical protein
VISLSIHNVHCLFLVLIKLFHPKPKGPESTSSDGQASSMPQSQRVKHDPAFDLIIARVSLAVEIVQYTLVLLSRDVTLYIAATILSSFGGGFSPAILSLAVELAKTQSGDNINSNSSNRTDIHGSTATAPNTATTSTAAPNPTSTEPSPESDADGGENYGQLFGGLAVVQALCSQMLGPSVFGAIFVGTIKTFPKGIFVAALSVVFTGLVCLSLIRVPRRAQGRDQDEEARSDDPERQPLLGEHENVNILEG